MMSLTLLRALRLILELLAQRIVPHLVSRAFTRHAQFAAAHRRALGARRIGGRGKVGGR
ncbi:MAG: hypothetical protein AAFR55_09485 [Pseudomonadota bacterium]